MSEDRSQRQYTREEAREILRRAAERTHAEGIDGLRHDELVVAAREAGIDLGALEEAAGELTEARRDRLAVDAWNAARRRSFGSHVVTWLVVNTGLFLIDLVGGGGFWFFWPLLWWGIFVALHGVSAYRAPTAAQVERVTRRERRKREAERRREQRQREREARRRRGKGDWPPMEFERAVEAGVDALMTVARKVDEATRRAPRGPVPDTEFNRYVERKQQRAPSAREESRAEASRPPRVRVDIDEHDSDDFDVESSESERRELSRKARR